MQNWGSRRYQGKIFGKEDSDDITVGRQTRLYMKKQYVVLYVTTRTDREVTVLDRKIGSVIPAHRRKYSVNPSQGMMRPRLLVILIRCLCLPGPMPSTFLTRSRVHAMRSAAYVGSRDASPQVLRGVRHDGGPLAGGRLSQGGRCTGSGCASWCFRSSVICQGRKVERSGGVLPP